MTVFSGFFNSNENHDRMYNAEHFSRFFDGIICDGVYVNFPEDELDRENKAFYVKPSTETGLKVVVAQGRAWLMGTWTWNNAPITLTFDATTTDLYNRIDTVVLDVNVGNDARHNDILVVKGNEAQNPDRPTLIDTSAHKQYPLAYVYIPGGATSITASNITQAVDTGAEGDTPSVEALLELASRSIQEMKDSFQSGVDTIYNAIYANGGVPNPATGSTPTHSVSECVAGINNIRSDGSASASQILINQTAWVGKEKKTGTMPDRGAQTATVQPGNTYTIPAGYHNGSGVVTGGTNGVASGNATTDDVLAGKTFSKTNSVGLTGTMANRGAQTSSLNCSESYTIPKGYHNGEGKVTANSLSSQTKVDSGKTGITASTVLTGYQGWYNGNKITGTMANQGKKTASINCGGSYTIPAGYHNGEGKVTGNSLASQTGVDSGKTAVDAAHMVSGYQGYVNGNKISGSMTNQGAYTASVGNANNDSYLYLRIPQGAYLTNGGAGYPEITVPLRNNPSYSMGYGEGQAQGRADRNGSWGIYVRVWTAGTGQTSYGGVLNMAIQLARGWYDNVVWAHGPISYGTAGSDTYIDATWGCAVWTSFNYGLQDR